MTHELRVRPDKVGSVCSPFSLRPYLSVSPDPVAEEGTAVVGRVLNVSRTYGKLELPSGRPALLVTGDLIVGALGNRAALRGFCGRVPKQLKKGDTLWLLNKGGVIGESDGATVGLGEPIRLEIIGTPMRDGRPLQLSDYGIPQASALPKKMPPVLLVIATCMNAGKTTAAGVAVHDLTTRGLRVHAGKATGVAALADLLSFADNGAVQTCSFLDAGLPSTCYHQDVPNVTRTLLSQLATEDPDVIVLELGDGLLGSYGVDDILDDKELVGCFTGALIAANDIIGGYSVARHLKERNIPVAALTGPATDNDAGRRKLAELGFNAANIFQQSAEVCRMVRETLGVGDGTKA
jgi:CheY-like chemotaxis protein